LKTFKKREATSNAVIKHGPTFFAWKIKLFEVLESNYKVNRNLFAEKSVLFKIITEEETIKPHQKKAFKYVNQVKEKFESGVFSLSLGFDEKEFLFSVKEILVAELGCQSIEFVEDNTVESGNPVIEF